MATPWTTLASRRFGGDIYERIITFQPEDQPEDTLTVHVKCHPNGLFDISVHTPSVTEVYKSVPGHLDTPTTLSTTLGGTSLRTTIVSQPPPASLPASTSPSTAERLHIFDPHTGHKTTLVIPSPKYLLSLSGDILGSTKAKGVLKAPMPSVVVEVKVALGEKVERGQALVVLESMKTETVLRSEVDGVVRAVGCVKGEMVEEGRVLVDVESPEGEGEKED